MDHRVGGLMEDAKELLEEMDVRAFEQTTREFLELQDPGWNESWQQS